MKKIKKTRLVNIFFLTTILVCYFLLVYLIYRDVGFDDWNFRNALPPANVSPFMFSSLVIYVFLPKKIGKYWSTLIALLSLGMFCAMVLECVSRIVIGYKFHARFFLDYYAHFALSLFGIYLVKSEQITLQKRECLIGGGLIVLVALIMLVVNLICDTAFFGLALNEKYNIYNMVLVPNAYLSALLYLLGLIAVLILGFFYLKILTRRRGVSPRGDDKPHEEECLPEG